MARILCVEDDDDSQYMMHRRLSHAGYEVKVSANGKQAVDWAKTLLPDLIVMDLNLPGLDGWEATRQLKNQPETKHIPIIVVTGRMSEASREKAVAAGCDDYATKPVDFNALVTKIEALLGRSAAE
jgi:two-component system, cell cycle response regulator DivK